MSSVAGHVMCRSLHQYQLASRPQLDLISIMSAASWNQQTPNYDFTYGNERAKALVRSHNARLTSAPSSTSPSGHHWSERRFVVSGTPSRASVRTPSCRSGLTGSPGHRPPMNRTPQANPTGDAIEAKAVDTMKRAEVYMDLLKHAEDNDPSENCLDCTCVVPTILAVGHHPGRRIRLAPPLLLMLFSVHQRGQRRLLLVHRASFIVTCSPQQTGHSCEPQADRLSTPGSLSSGQLGCGPRAVPQAMGHCLGQQQPAPAQAVHRGHVVGQQVSLGAPRRHPPHQQPKSGHHIGCGHLLQALPEGHHHQAS